jgi:hypothetical protein
MTNENCLEGIKCPKCGNQDRFRIQSSTLAEVSDDGAEAGNIEWDDDSFTCCLCCDKTGMLRSFRTPQIPPEPINLEDLTRRALEVFWEVVCKAFPEAVTGDLSPGTTFIFEEAAEKAVKEWVQANVPKGAACVSFVS